MNSVVRTALAVVIALCGVALIAILAVNAVHDAGVLGYAKPLVAVLVTIRLLLWLRKDRAAKAGPTAKAGNDRKSKMIAIGLVIGLGAPFVLLWLLTSLGR